MRLVPYLLSDCYLDRLARDDQIWGLPVPQGQGSELWAGGTQF